MIKHNGKTHWKQANFYLYYWPLNGQLPPSHLLNRMLLLTFTSKIRAFLIIAHSISVLDINSSIFLSQPPCALYSHMGTSPCQSSCAPPCWTDNPLHLPSLTPLHPWTSVPFQPFICWHTHAAQPRFDSQSVILSFGSNHLAAHLTKPGEETRLALVWPLLGALTGDVVLICINNVNAKIKLSFAALVIFYSSKHVVLLHPCPLSHRFVKPPPPPLCF